MATDQMSLSIMKEILSQAKIDVWNTSNDELSLPLQGVLENLITVMEALVDRQKTTEIDRP